AVNQIIRFRGQQGLARVFSLRHEFPTEWYRFLNPPVGAAGDQTMTLGLTKEHFPLLVQDNAIVMTTIELYVKVKNAFIGTHNDSTVKTSLQPGTVASTTSLKVTAWNVLLRAEKNPAGALGNWTLAVWLTTGTGLHK